MEIVASVAAAIEPCCPKTARTELLLSSDSAEFLAALRDLTLFGHTLVMGTVAMVGRSATKEEHAAFEESSSTAEHFPDYRHVLFSAEADRLWNEIQRREGKTTSRMRTESYSGRSIRSPGYSCAIGQVALP